VRTHPVDKLLEQHCYKSAAGLLQLERFYVCIPTLPLFEMAESACSPFCYVLHYLLFIKFVSAFYHVCVTGQLL
jgi:hypothetical protein